jgi:SAM-dependent methyltransferase
MDDGGSWHEQDEFWRRFGPVMFSSRRRQAAAGEVDDLLRLIPLEPGAAVLDLACGEGRHSLALARRGFRVTGVDRTVSYLDQAREAASREGLEVEFVRDDMREFARPRTFAAAINLYTSFGYFDDQEDDRRVVTNVYRSLRAGGSFVIETHGREDLARSFHERDLSELADGSFFLEERTLAADGRSLQTRWTLMRGEERHSASFTVRYYAAGELVSLLLSCGFSEAQTYGGLGGGPYDDAARDLVAVARK